MISIKANMPIISLVVLWIILQFISFWALYFEEQWFERILILNIIFMIFFIVFIYTKVLKKTTNKNNINSESSKGYRNDFLYLKCPQCQESFAIKKSKSLENKTLTILCPICGTKGKISVS